MALLAFPTASVQAQSAAARAPFQWPAGTTAADCRPGTVVFRVADTHRPACSATAVAVPALRDALAALGATALERVFPHSPAPSVDDYKREPRCVDLTLVYRVRYAAPVPLAEAVSRLRATGTLRYAEPEYRVQVAFTPNDPSYSQLAHLPQIHAPEAWDLEQGDTTVVVGIVDTGFDLNHPDLIRQWARNYADPVNGIDDDGDGYTDNFLGWDLAGPYLAQPSQDNGAGGGGAHGSHVAGLAGAGVNNATGVAGVGYKCRLLPVKCGPDDNGGYIINAYPGVVYAADHRAAVINCSWGALGYPDVGQDAINYATFNRGALVVVAAGNNNSPNPFSPGGFENVLTVGAVDGNDVKAGFSNYGVNAEVFAPGVALLSTIPTSNYSLNSGTSMASPVASGAAALVKAHFRSASAEQVGQRLRMSCDNIDAQNNAALAGLLGRGRINARRALTEDPSAVRCLRKQVAVGGGAFQELLPGVTPPLFPGSTAQLVGDFKSILKPTTGLTATLTCLSATITIQQGVVTLGNLATGQVLTNTTQPFTFTVSPTAPIQQVVRFVITYTDQAGYQDTERFELLLNPSWRDLTVNRIATTLTSKGRIGFNDNVFAQGLGMNYRNQDNLISELGLLVGIDSTHVPNTVTRVYGYPPTADDHFAPTLLARPSATPRADADFVTVCTDAAAPADVRIGLRIRTRALAWAAAARQQFVLFEYTLTNTNPQAVQNLYAGLFADWDIGNGFANKAAWDSTRLLGYGFSNEPDSSYAGIRFIGPAALASYRAIDFNTNAPGNPWGITDGFTMGEKWRALSRGVSRTQAGIGRGADIATISGAGPYALAAGDSVTLVFALVAGENLTDLQAAADAAAAVYQPQPNGFGAPGRNTYPAGAPYPNPLIDGQGLIPSTPGATALQLFDIQGRCILRQALSASPQTTPLDLRTVAPGIYILRLTGPKFTPVAHRVVVGNRL